MAKTQCKVTSLKWTEDQFWSTSADKKKQMKTPVQYWYLLQSSSKYSEPEHKIHMMPKTTTKDVFLTTNQGMMKRSGQTHSSAVCISIKRCLAKKLFFIRFQYSSLFPWWHPDNTQVYLQVIRLTYVSRCFLFSASDTWEKPGWKDLHILFPSHKWHTAV